MKRNKAIAVTLAATLAVSTMLAGTYAWQSISQKARNVVRETKNPGARLHDDFNWATSGNTDVYVENFTSDTDGGVQVYARVRIDEYMEIGTLAGSPTGTQGKSVTIIKDSATPAGVDIDDVTTWTTYKWDREKAIEAGTTTGWKIWEETSNFRKYMLWNQDNQGTVGKTYYMPTFDKNKDSDEADINATWEGTSGTGVDPYDDNVVYGSTDKVTNIAVYDADNNDVDEAKSVDMAAILDQLTTKTTTQLASGESVEKRTWDTGKVYQGGTAITTISVGGTTYGVKVVDDGNQAIEYIEVALDLSNQTDYNVKLVEEEHTAVETLAPGTANLISMDKWITGGGNKGNF